MPPLISIQHVGLARGHDVLFLDASFDLVQGDRLAVIGGSGCGKSSLLDAILGRCTRRGRLFRASYRIRNRFPKTHGFMLEKGILDAIDKKLFLVDGTIEIAGIPMESGRAAMKWLSRNAGVLFQNDALFDGCSVADNLSFPIKYADESPADRTPETERDILTQLLEDVQMIESTDNGDSVEHLLNRKVDRLSGGERKRVALARAIALKPRLLLLDEPTSGLDHATSLAIANTIRSICDREQTTVLCITHDPEFAHNIACNKVAEINKELKKCAVNRQREVPERAVCPEMPPDPADPRARFNEGGRKGALYVQSFLRRFLGILLDGAKLCIPVALIAGAGLAIQGAAGPRLIQAFLPQGIVAGVFLGMGTIVPALLIIGLCAAGLTGELAQKKSTAQLEYLRTIGVRSSALFAVPFILGLAIAVPLLVWLSEFLMVCGSALALRGFEFQSRISSAKLWHEAWQLINLPMFLKSGIKGITHGVLIGMSVCWAGFRSGPGESGLRRAISFCVILSSLLVIVADVLWSWYWAG